MFWYSSSERSMRIRLAPIGQIPTQAVSPSDWCSGAPAPYRACALHILGWLATIRKKNTYKQSLLQTWFYGGPAPYRACALQIQCIHIRLISDHKKEEYLQAVSPSDMVLWLWSSSLRSMRIRLAAIGQIPTSSLSFRHGFMVVVQLTTEHAH